MTDSSGGFAYQDPPDEEASHAQEQPTSPPLIASGRHLDAAATEAVLKRAFELAEMAPSRDVVLSRSKLAEIAADVDLPVASVAAALAEHLIEGTDDESLLDRIVGSDRVSVRRRSTASEDEMRDRAMRLLEVSHGMRARVQLDGVVVASKRKDAVGKIARTVRDAQGLGQLGKLRRIEMAAVDVGDEPGALVLSADIGDRRNSAIAGGAVVGTVGSLATAGAAAVLSPFVGLGIPVAVGVGLMMSRAIHRSAVRETEDHLDEAADSLVTGAEPDGMISSSAKRALDSLWKRKRGR